MQSSIVRWGVLVVVLVIGYFFFVPVFQKPLPPVPVVAPKPISSLKKIVIGQSVEGRDLDAYHYGSGQTHLLFIGGIHGGYEWNSVVLAYELIAYLNKHPDVVPNNLTVTVIPSANPDGVYKVVGKEGRFSVGDIPIHQSTVSGRLKSQTVDLNRNFDCKWQAQSHWRDQIVSAGSKPFSEPESQVIRDVVLEINPKAVVFWHSQSGAVYASACQNGILPETLKVMNVYAQAAGYKSVKTFDAYETTGDAEAWLASINIPAITVELTTHEAIEFEKNLAGVQALFEYYNK